ncbi:MAG: thioesterase [Saprospiraceae bacterium]|nr:MAG: thioesterase [Saprospiraceae bacterium]
MYSHQTQKRVRYGEVDRMGYLYYGHYAFYYEIGRVEWLRSLGVLYKDMEEKMHIMLPVVALQMRFVRPARYDEILTITTTLRSMPDRYITFHMEIHNEAGKLVNGGTVRLAFVDMDTGKVVPIPEVLRKKLEPFFSDGTSAT